MRRSQLGGASRNSWRDKFVAAFEQENLFVLRNFLNFYDVSNMPHATFIPAKSSQALGVASYFSGYLFKPSPNVPFQVFQNGFALSEPVQLQDDSAPASNRSQISGGVTASLSAVAAGCRICEMKTGHVYLINGTEFAAVAKGRPKLPEGNPLRLSEHELLSCEVKFTHCIPNSYVVGCVWPTMFPQPGMTIWYPRLTPPPHQLSLAVNPRSLTENSGRD